jgi:hypothetical protein
VNWIGLAEDRDRWGALVIAVMNLRVPEHAVRLWSGFTTGDLSSGFEYSISTRVSYILYI